MGVPTLLDDSFSGKRNAESGVYRRALMMIILNVGVLVLRKILIILASQFELSLMQTFLAVYRMGSVTRAAKSLGITQPGASGRYCQADIDGMPLQDEHVRRGNVVLLVDNTAGRIADNCLDGFAGALSRDLDGKSRYAGWNGEVQRPRRSDEISPR